MHKFGKIKLQIKDNNIFHIGENKKLKELIESIKEKEKKEKDILIQYYSDRIDNKKRYCKSRNSSNFFSKIILKKFELFKVL